LPNRASAAWLTVIRQMMAGHEYTKAYTRCTAATTENPVREADVWLFVKTEAIAVFRLYGVARMKG
jgi:hypothetical protein